MANQVDDYRDSKALIFGKTAEAAPKARRAGGAEPRCDQVLTTKVGLHIPVGLAFEDWERAGRQLSGLLNSSSWWLGDWLIYGKDQYADRYERGIRAAGLQYQTLRNYAWVSRRFELHRRRPALSFQHHAELASLPVEEQEAWLDRAERMKWNTKQLRNAIRAERAGTSQQSSAVAATRRLAVPDNRLQWWHKAAAHAGTELGEWVTATLDAAASQLLNEGDRHLPLE
ncbi:LmbU family transcriptional regulator [Streptomyces phaeochromogenes]|uniref:LmbU family transcriptional regulator n=1 Tax=Streptomyces phaeochromogenes TaxID=1923 RepID=UPI00386C6565|nr:LmbU family transcriptional regulator [Streptomyces phaeochromogenes]WSW20961.1 LmbU family transcriptional regulator [Streptomyces phaeochromogenes]WTA09896.1 LmbU family transcriptional regulator [Streptomyces phaeochromogenes]